MARKVLGDGLNTGLHQAFDERDASACDPDGIATERPVPDHPARSTVGDVEYGGEVDVDVVRGQPFADLEAAPSDVVVAAGAECTGAFHPPDHVRRARYPSGLLIDRYEQRVRGPTAQIGDECA